jgi:hypothetical protein
MLLPKDIIHRCHQYQENRVGNCRHNGNYHHKRNPEGVLEEANRQPCLRKVSI